MQEFSDIKLMRGVRMNLDTSAELAQPMEFGEIWNMLEQNGEGKLTNMKGYENLSSSFTMPVGVNTCIGTATDVENSTIIYFICNDRGNHGIMQFSTETKALEWILKDEPLLNFQPTYRISADVIEGLLYWTDGYFNSFLNNDFNPPRKVNIAKAIAYTAAYNSADRWTFYMVAEAGSLTGNPAYANYTAYVGTGAYVHTVGTNVVAWALDGINRYKNSTGYGTVQDQYVDAGTYVLVTDRPWQDTTIVEKQIAGHMLTYAPNMYFGLDWQVMDRVKYPPRFAPTAAFESDTSVPYNNLRNDMFQFAYRWVYDDNEKSVFSPKSEVPLPSTVGLLNGSFFADETIDNNIKVWMDSGPLEVKSVELAVRKGNEGNWFVIYRKYKYDESLNLVTGGENDIYIGYNFFNTELGEPIDQADPNRPYDAVPQVSNHQEIIEKNRLLDADYWQDYDNVNIDVSLTNVQAEATVGSIGGEYNAFTTLIIDSTTPPYNKFTSGEIYLDNFWEPGFTYIFNLESYPHKYDDPNGAIQSGSVEDVYGEFAYKIINSQAIVDCPVGMSFEDFSDSVVANLRNGNALDSSVIAINAYNYTGFHSYGGFVKSQNGAFVQFPSAKSIGFIIQTFDGDFGPCQYCADMSVNIIKISNRSVTPTFKSGAKHPFGIMYMDRASRFGGVNKSLQSEIYVPSQIDGESVHQLYRNNIRWTINHIPPEWATHYAWAYAKNSSVQSTLFATISNISTIDASNSIFICVNQYIVDQNELIRKFNVPAYTWQSGDRIRFIGNKGTDNVFRTIPVVLDFQIDGILDPADDHSGSTYVKNDFGDYVLDASGNKIKDPRQTGILVSYFNYNLHGIEVDNTIVEIYRPKKEGTEGSTVFYEFETVRSILNPHTENRAHEGGTDGLDQVIANGVSIRGATGQFNSGDAYLNFRVMENLFPCESFSFSDYFNSEVISIGTINATDRNVRRTRFLSRVLFSGKLIQNTRVNDLSRVNSTDSTELADKYGAIHHIEEVGDTLKILQKSKPSSLYIGRAGVTQPSADATDILSSTKDVLGTLIVHRSDYGTVHAGSVVKNENRHYWFDFYAHAICRDPGNGIQNLTEAFGLSRYMQAKCKLFGTAANVDVVSAYDQANEIVWFTFIDKTTTANSFTLGFRDTGGRNNDGFALLSHALPDAYGFAKQTLTSFKNGELWLHNSDSAPRCNFYGTQYKYWLTAIINKSADTVKRMLQLIVSTNAPVSCPNAGDLYVLPNDNHPQGMQSLLKAGAFTPVQGKYVADIGRNMTTNQATAELADLIEGDDMEGQAMTVRIEGEQTTEHKIFTVEVKGVTT